jgi:hypothetical protein
MAPSPLSHYSPVFANKAWAENEQYRSYYVHPHWKEVESKPKGKKQWGRKRGLYTWDVEKSLNTNLENEAAQIYASLLAFEEPDLQARITWAQFLMSQHVRTPTFMRYEKGAANLLDYQVNPDHDRVGCPECGDLACITSREWCFLIAHEDDFFIRSDNPLLLTGFVERPQTCLFYPLSPRVCFAACSQKDNWVAVHPDPQDLHSIWGIELAKGGAWMINFYLARGADESIILPPSLDGSLAETMFGDVLGKYPQPPFSLHEVARGEIEDAFESIRMIMSTIDGKNYPTWLPLELEPLSRSTYTPN